MNIKSVALLLIVGIVVVTGLVFLTSTGNNPPAKFLNYALADEARPRANVPVTRNDLGTMKVSQNKQADFTITNKGEKPLQIGYLSSSCGCTVGQIISNGKTSREYGMHDPGQDIVEVAPNDSAVIRVIYRPSVMPVFGLIEREVYVQTNDPEKTRLVLQVTANVQ